MFWVCRRPLWSRRNVLEQEWRVRRLVAPELGDAADGAVPRGR